MTASDKWYCSLPWTGFSNDPDGKVRPCCLYKDYIRDESGELMYVQTHTMEEIFHSDFMKDLRQQFRDGKKPAGCRTCIVDEKNGHRSKREIYERFKDGTTEHLVDFEGEPGIPSEFQMIISNACNLKCRSCTPSHSNLWQAEHKQVWGHTAYDMPHGQSGSRDGLLWKNRHEWYKTIKNLEIVGGEPFYIGQWNEIWDEMIDLGVSKNIRISMSSNAVIYAADRLESIAENFDHVGLGLSIDGMGAVYDYLRHPGRWTEVSENVRRYSEWRSSRQIANLDISISHTISWVNVWWLPEFRKWLDENTQGFKFWYNLVHSPDHMALWALPMHAKDLIEEKLLAWGQDAAEVSGILNHMHSRQPSNEELNELYEKFRIYDKTRKEDIKKIVPEELKPYLTSLLENQSVWKS